LEKPSFSGRIFSPSWAHKSDFPLYQILVLTSIYKERIKRWYDKRLKKEFKGDKVLYNSRFKTFRKGKLQSKWDRPYVVHSVLSNGAVTIMDLKGDHFMVNGQWLTVYYELDVVPLHHIDVFTMEEEPERPA
jgi:hypothetical protein